MEEKKVQESTAKVTVGFKCDANLKGKLSKDASQLGISLSEFTEGIITNHYNSDKPNVDVKTKDIGSVNPSQEITTCFEKFETKLSEALVQEISPVISSVDEIKELLIGLNANKDKAENEPEKDETLVNLIQENENLSKELDAITNNEGLKQLFEKYKGKNLEYQNAEGEIKKIKVESYSDIITALVETIIDKQ